MKVKIDEIIKYHKTLANLIDFNRKSIDKLNDRISNVVDMINELIIE